MLYCMYVGITLNSCTMIKLVVGAMKRHVMYLPPPPFIPPLDKTHVLFAFDLFQLLTLFSCCYYYYLYLYLEEVKEREQKTQTKQFSMFFFLDSVGIFCY